MNHINKIKVIQHNVLKWTYVRGNELSNYFQNENADVILMNSTGIPDQTRIKNFNCNIYQRNVLSEANAGIAIAVKKNIGHQLIDDFQGDMLAVKVETTKGPIILSTMYLPPRRNFIPLADIRRLLQKNNAVYICADMNGRHPQFGYATENNTGKEVVGLIRNNICKHLGPDFNTLINRLAKGRPDIVLSNRVANLYNRIYEGNLTSSDHIPVIVELSTQPIMVQCPPKWNLKKTNWVQFNERVNIEMMDNERKLRGEINMTKPKVEEYLGNWMNTIINNIEITTPKRLFKIIPNIKESDTLKLLEQRYQRLRFQTNSWTRDQLDEIKNLQNLIIEENKNLNETYWNKKKIYIMTQQNFGDRSGC